jgi:hypothetical protein
MKSFTIYLAALAALFSIPCQLNAAIIGVSSSEQLKYDWDGAPIIWQGVTVDDADRIIDPPTYALNDEVTNTMQQGFNERQGVLLPWDLQVDNGTIAAGTRVHSHMIFFNIGEPGAIGVDWGVEWVFSGNILGVMSDKNGEYEVATSSILGAPGTEYPTAPFYARGLDQWFDGSSGEGYTISGNTLTLGMTVSNPGDWVRVITENPGEEPVPEPGTLLLLGTGLVSLAGYGKFSFRRRKKA